MNETEQSSAPDPRLVTAEVTERAVSPMGLAIEPGSHIALTELTKLDTGGIVAFLSPAPPAFYLLSARALRDAAVPGLDAALASAEPAISGEHAVLGDHVPVLLDAFGGLTAAVLLSLAAIEAAANAAIDRLPDDATITVKRLGQQVEISKTEMVRRLSLSEKLDQVPVAEGRPSIKDKQDWHTFVELRRLRDDLVHVKEDGYSNDPEAPSPFGRLLRGEASQCVEQSARIIIAIWPSRLSPESKKALGL